MLSNNTISTQPPFPLPPPHRPLLHMSQFKTSPLKLIELSFSYQKVDSYAYNDHAFCLPFYSQ